MDIFCPAFGQFLLFSYKKHYERAQKNHWNFEQIGMIVPIFRHYERFKNYHWNILGISLKTRSYPHVIHILRTACGYLPITQ